MMGSFLTRGLIMALGYAYPAYECYKTVERNKPEIEQLRFWCQYWILVAVLTISERFGDTFISWLPMYCEAKLAFYVYLWYPKTRGTTYVYDTFFKPYIAKHEMEIDRSLIELRIRAGDIAVDYWRRAATCAQTRFFDILQFVASQSQPSRSRTVQKPQPAQVAQPAVSARISAVQQKIASQQPKQPPPPPPPKQQQLPKQPVSPSKAQAREQSKEPTPSVAASPAKNQAKEQFPKDAEGASSAVAVSSAPSKTQSAPASASSPTKASEQEQMNVEVTSEAPAPVPSEPPKEIVLEDAIRVTRGRLRKTRSGATTTNAH